MKKRKREREKKETRVELLTRFLSILFTTRVPCRNERTRFFLRIIKEV